MGAVDVGIGHQDDLVIPQLRDVELVADAGAEGRDDRRQLVVADDLVDPRLLDVQHLAPEGKDGLILSLSAFLGRAAGGITLDDVQFGQFVALVEAVEQLAG